MVEVLQKSYNISSNENADHKETYQESPSQILYDSAKNTKDHTHLNGENNSDEEAPRNRVRRRVQHFSESDNDREQLTYEISNSVAQNNTKTPQSSDSEDDLTIFKSVPRKSRIKKNEHDSCSDSSNSGKAQNSRLPSGSDSDTTNLRSTSCKSRILKDSHENSSESDQAGKNKQQHMRMKNKRDKMKEKFKSLKKLHGKGMPTNVENETIKSMSDKSEDSNDESSSIEKIKQKIKEKLSSIPSICDPDTSDEENGEPKSNAKQRMQKRTKLIAPKPRRMSAKQAMENMQKIRSESNRMLREKEVSLPYHRPKALSLKDIMSRRKPALSADGKSLPIKMNGDQLRHYAKMLEERQNEMKELWQSDTDGENDDKKSDNEKSFPCNMDDNHKSTKNNQPSDETESATADGIKLIDDEASTNSKEITDDVTPEESDKLFEDLNQSYIEETKKYNDKDKARNQDVESTDNVIEKQDSANNMTLVYDDSETSVTAENTADVKKADELSTNEGEPRRALIDNTVKNANGDENKAHDAQESLKNNTKLDSQLISLHFDTENDDTEKLDSNSSRIAQEPEKLEMDGMEVDAFSDDNLNMDDIDNIIENADIIRDIEDKVNSQVLIRDRPLNLKPKLTGAPGMVIDLDDSNMAPKKSGVELLKERFTFFAKLKTPEEIERDNKRRIKPGNQHLRLKQELEEQMADQRTLEWEKRLEAEKQQQKELKELRGEESEDENDIDKIEAQLEEKELHSKQALSESEDDEELVEDDIEMKDKPRVKNPMLENEAEESDCDEPKESNEENESDEDDNNNSNDENDDEDNSSDSESSESEEENQTSTKKGRILMAFEDSDDEDPAGKVQKDGEKSAECSELLGTQTVSQDDVLTLAQRHKSLSEDLFTSQGSSLQPSQKKIKSTQSVPESLENDVDLGTQTFSILDSTTNVTEMLDGSDKLDAIGDTQTYYDNMQPMPGIGSGSFSQDLPPLPITQVSQSQPIGEDILAMCTGKFYDNEFVSQEYDNNQMPLGASQEYDSDENSAITFGKVLGTDNVDTNKDKETEVDKVVNTCNGVNMDTEEMFVEKVEEIPKTDSNKTQNKMVDDNLKSILDELDDPEFDAPKPNKYFCGAKTQKAEDALKDNQEAQVRKKFTIESDDEINEGEVSGKKKKKIKRKRLEKRALQISDDEEDLSDQEEAEVYESEIEEEKEERLVEYDSEENEIEIKPQTVKQAKKKRKTTEFFEQEAELTSEDEWVGSGDEDEAGLDRMEREEGDDENFHQGRLQRELGQIHMRDVLDQDKREVRIIQELLFEDGDLGAGGRQRKFKWKNLDGDEETGTGTDEFGDTQEQEFESEEQWRKQRHERETFLRQMQNNSEHDDILNVSVNRTTIIKANLMSKTMSMLLEENQHDADKDSPIVPEKKTTLLSPKKPFSVLQQTYQGSILNRGKGALARLAALATPLAVADDAPKGKSAAPSSGRNFVFAALTPEAPKVMKRKADINPSTPKLVKKMKTEEKQSISKSRLLDHMKM